MKNFRISQTQFKVTAPNGLTSLVAPKLLITESFILALIFEGEIVVDFYVLEGEYDEGIKGIVEYGFKVEAWEQIYDEEGELAGMDFYILSPNC